MNCTSTALTVEFGAMSTNCGYVNLHSFFCASSLNWCVITKRCIVVSQFFAGIDITFGLYATIFFKVIVVLLVGISKTGATACAC